MDHLISLLLPLAATGFLLLPVAVVLLAWFRDGEGGVDDDDAEPGWGGGGVSPLGPDGPRDADGEPAWWPEFERHFADWVDRSQAGVLHSR